MRDRDRAALTARKQAIREAVWDELTRRRAARFPGARGRIPNFVGAEAAARALAGTPEWQAARALKANPDAPQLPVRARALADGKRLYVAVPRLLSTRPFLRLDPAELSVAPRRAVSIGGAARHGVPVTPGEVERLDLVVCGSVAVNRDGARLGKGEGFSDIEYALLVEQGLVDARTCLVTTVHPLQVLDGPLPETEHDFRVDLIVTPDEVIRPPAAARRRPPGLLWDHLTAEKLESIPMLRELLARRG